MNPCQYACQLKELKVKITCIRKDARCSYHKKGDELNINNLTSKGMCLSAYNSLYYISLGLLFDAKWSNQGSISKCSGVKDYIILQASFERLSCRLLFLNFIKRCLYRIYPSQIHRGRLVWRVVDGKGSCPLGHKIGDRFPISLGHLQITKNFLFNLGEPRDICPAVFHQLFPLLLKWKEDMRFPFSDEDLDFIQCPDHKANVSFKISEYN